MRMRKARSSGSTWSLLVALAVLLLGGIARADSLDLSIAGITWSPPPGPALQVTVSVVDGAEHPVRGLTAANFGVSIDEAEVEPVRVHPVAEAGGGIALQLAIDVSGSMKGAPIAAARAAAQHLVDRLGPSDIAGLSTFGSTIQEVVGFTPDRASLTAGLANLDATDRETRLNQALYDSVLRANNAPLPRAAVIILTDGKDEGSPVSIEDAVSNAARKSVPIYAVGLGARVTDAPLRRIATLTGGRYLSAASTEDLDRLYGLILDQLRDRYSISVDGVTPGDGPHTVTVRLRQRGFESRATRTWTPTPAGASQPNTSPSGDPVGVQERPSSAPPPPVPRSPSAEPQRASTRLAVVGVVCLLAVVGLGGGYFAWRRRQITTSRPCGWCGAPLEPKDDLYCANCRTKREEHDRAGTASSEMNAARADGDRHTELVWIDILRGPESVRAPRRVSIPSNGLTIGRGPDNTLDLRDDEISRHHARITTGPNGDYVIEDTDSHNGIFLNDKPTKQARLRNGDQIRVGATELVFADHRGTGTDS